MKRCTWGMGWSPRTCDQPATTKSREGWPLCNDHAQQWAKDEERTDG